MMSQEKQAQAKHEIDRSLIYCTIIMNRFGLSFEKPSNHISRIGQRITFVLFIVLLCTHILSEFIHIVVTTVNTPRIEDVVPLFHTIGYSTISLARLSAIWYKKDVFGRLLRELVEIWPVPPLSDEAQFTKERSIAALRLANQWYFALSMVCICFYNLTPVAVFLYELLWLGQEDAEVGYVWACWYPFDKHEPTAHVVVYLFEIISGMTCVSAMLASDLLFTALTSHICMLLRLLHQRLQALDSEHNLYDEVIGCIKLHQRLIRYCNEMETTFSIVNLVNVVISSVNICCVAFVIVLLEPLMAVSNKLFFISSLIQIGVICWYSDDIFRANADVAVAAYNSSWYKADPRGRRALLFLIASVSCRNMSEIKFPLGRGGMWYLHVLHAVLSDGAVTRHESQKPIGFTAMKFTALNLSTYSTILTRSYSYFTLLYAMYKKG